MDDNANTRTLSFAEFNSEVEKHEKAIEEAKQELNRRVDLLGALLFEQLGVTTGQEASLLSVVRMFQKLTVMAGIK